MKKLKPLVWNLEANVGFDGINREIEAIEDLNTYANHFYIRFGVHMYDFNCRTGKDMDPEYIAFMMLNATVIEQEYCTSFEEGRVLCEHWRNKFWNELYTAMMDNIFDGKEVN